MLKTIDIGHHNYALDKALSILETEVSTALHEGNVRAIKIIHGHGGGTLRNAVRSWCVDKKDVSVLLFLEKNMTCFIKTALICGLPVNPQKILTLELKIDL